MLQQEPIRTIGVFIELLGQASAKGYHFRTSLVDYLEENELIEGEVYRRQRRVIFHPRVERRSLCPLETVCLMLMTDGIIEKRPVHHPLVAAQRIGLHQILAVEIIKATNQSPGGYSRTLRKRILRACNVPSD